MKAYGGVDVYIYIFFASAIVGGDWSASRPGRFTPGERTPGTHWIGVWVDPRAGLDVVEKRIFLTITGLDLRPLGRPASSQSQYRLRYPRTQYVSCKNDDRSLPVWLTIFAITFTYNVLLFIIVVNLVQNIAARNNACFIQNLKIKTYPCTIRTTANQSINERDNRRNLSPISNTIAEKRKN
jgi:hypothetical protein